MPRTIYLCGPIQGRTDEDCQGWRERAKQLWTGDYNDPLRRDYRGRELQPGVPAEIVANDTADIQCSDALLVYFDKPSVGTAMEIYMAHTLGRPVVVVDASGQPLSPWLVHHATIVVKSLDEAINHLELLL
jgi:nucleoside 2-deoxyribosyltransferase